MNDLKHAAWEELINYIKEQKTELPGEKTAYEFAKELGIKYKAATYILNKQEKMGKLSSRMITLDGHRIKVYKPK